MSKKSAYFQMDDLWKKAQIKDIKQGLDSIHGVLSVSYSPEKATLAVDFDTTGTDADTISKKLSALGYEASMRDEEDHVM